MSETATQTVEAPVVPDKFKNQDGSINSDALLKSYLELEKSRSSSDSDTNNAAATTPAPAAATTPAPAAETTPAPAATTPAPQGDAVDQQLQPFYDEFEQGGTLSDDSFTKLESMGYPRSLVEHYMTLTKGARDQHVASLISKAGGEDRYTQMGAWAQQNWSAEEVAAYNAAMDGWNNEAREAAVAKLTTAYVAANGTPGRMFTGAADTNSTGLMAYSSDAQMQADMKSPQYRSDPAFRLQVKRRIAVTMGADPTTVRAD